MKRNRREFIKRSAAAAAFLAWRPAAWAEDALDPALAKDWLGRWQKEILAESKRRYCDTEMGEELGWLVSPFLNGFYYGWRATGGAQWLERLADWTHAWTSRGITEPDGFTGWPKKGTGGLIEDTFYTDSLLGEAMALRPAVMAARDIAREPALKERFGGQAQSWLRLAEATFDKWSARGCWREVKNGGVWAVPAFGIDQQTNGWTEGYARRASDGFTEPDNKQNLIARWLLALHGATGKTIYREHAAQWWNVMRSRMKTREDGKYFVWNYWEPAGPWDYKPNGAARHWAGVHPNGGYYDVDVGAIVEAFEHKLVFTREDIDKLIATNRDFMWNQQVHGAKFQRIDGGEPDSRWKNSPGLLWEALVFHDAKLREVFLANYEPDSWGGLSATPWFLAGNKVS
ncbi:MAG TPA: hypothetical protein VGO59_06765 [Verrucomicrobiae bacterium]|jgi:hypothetical protein